MAVKVVTPPAELVVSVDEAKAHLRIDHDDDDLVIEGMIEAATEYAERFLGRALIDQTLDVYFDEFPAGSIPIPFPPLIELVGVFYSDTGGTELPFTDYSVDDAGGRIYLPTGGAWPPAFDGPNAVRVRVRAGYLDTGVSPPVANVPKSIKAAILLYVGALYEFREQLTPGTVLPLPWGAEQLLRMLRVEKSMA